MNRSAFGTKPRTCSALLAVGLSLASAALSQTAPPLLSGVDRSTADAAVRVQDDAFLAIEGKWLAETRIRADRSSAGGFTTLYDNTQPELRELVETAAAGRGDDPSGRKIGDLYASFMDEAAIEALGYKPVRDELARANAIRTSTDIAALIGANERIGIDAPFSAGVHQDAKDSSKYVFDIGQSGIALPDRDYFLQKDDKRFADVRAKYEAYLAKILGMVGEKNADAKAKAIVALEARIAEAQWTRVENRDPVKTYNVYRIADLPKLAPHIAWTRYFAAVGLTGKTDSVVIDQPTYFKKLDTIIAATPIDTWRAYFVTRTVESYGAFLGRDFVDANFAFFRATLRGTEQNRARWERGVGLVEASVGESLGQLYVAKYFPPESKARMDALVQNLLTAYRTSVGGLDWMGPQTKQEALRKLSTFTPKIGYPTRWRDYSTLVVERGELVGNVKRARAFEYQRNLDKLGRPIDREEWGMTPQTINAYYNPEMNEVVFPAAILQAPFFNAKADDAVNYGAIGAVIGHEISHGFDDQGSQYDEKGNLRNWWTDDDRRRFAEKTKALIAQYGAYVVAGYHVNGELTLGENIADNSGLAIAYKAYRLSLAGKEAPVIDGLTGDQRFFMGFVQVWQEKNREASIVAQIKSDPHSPGEFRANGTLTNQPGFYEAFGVKPGDRMYTEPDKRVIIW